MQTWTYFSLYWILDPGPVCRRYVMGWLVAERESATLADHLIAETYRKQGIIPEKLTLSADRGSAMTSKKIALPHGQGGSTQGDGRGGETGHTGAAAFTEMVVVALVLPAGPFTVNTCSEHLFHWADLQAPYRGTAVRHSGLEQRSSKYYRR